MSDTPKTDEIVARWSAPTELIGHARTLERQNRELREALEEAEAWITHYGAVNDPNNRDLLPKIRATLAQPRTLTRKVSRNVEKSSCCNAECQGSSQ